MDLHVGHAFRPLKARGAWWFALVLLCQAGPACGLDLGIIELADLDFGAVIDADGSVVLGLSDAITSDPASIHVGSPTSSGRYQISGDPFAVFSLSILGSTASGLTIDDFVTSEGVPPLLAVVLDGTGHKSIRLGATLTVDESTAVPGLDQPLIYIISIDYN